MADENSSDSEYDEKVSKKVKKIIERSHKEALDIQKMKITSKQKKCESCDEMFFDWQLKLHIKSCHKYFLHMEKLPNGYFCKLCLLETTTNEDESQKPRVRMYQHLKNQVL